MLEICKRALLHISDVYPCIVGIYCNYFNVLWLRHVPSSNQRPSLWLESRGMPQRKQNMASWSIFVLYICSIKRSRGLWVRFKIHICIHVLYRHSPLVFFESTAAAAVQLMIFLFSRVSLFRSCLELLAKDF